MGFGNMGFHMVWRLLEHGHAVVAYDVRPESLQAVQGLGALGAVSPADVADKASGYWSVSPPGVARQVALASDGLGRGGAIRASTWICRRRAPRGVAKEAGQSLEMHGIAPVSGGT